MTEAFKEGLRLCHSGLYEQALYFLEDIDPVEFPDAAYYQALCYSKLGKAGAALDALALVVTQETNFLKLVQARMIQAFLLTTERRFDEAEKALATMLADGMESVQVYSNYGYVLWALGRSKEGIAWLNRALAKDPENANALNSMGYLLADQGVLLDKALAFCRKALELKPNHPPYLDSLAWTYYKMGHPKQALSFMEKALSDDPNNPDYLAHQTTILQALGQTR